MPLEQQVCSLELAKRLKELGVKQSLLWRWAVPKGVEHKAWIIDRHAAVDTGSIDYFTAFTVAELGEMLKLMAGAHTWFCNGGNGMEWQATYQHCKKRQYASTEADARAKCLIYLLENNLLEVTK